MADNYTTNPGSGGKTFGSDEIDGINYPRGKSCWGPDGTLNETDIAPGKAFPVQLRTPNGDSPVDDAKDAVRVVNATAADLQVTEASAAAAKAALELLDDAVKVDDAGFTPATDKVLMIGAEADETAPDAVDEGDAGALRMTLNRALHANLRNAAGAEIGTSSVPVRTDPTGTTTQPVSHAASSQADGHSVTLGAQADAAAGSDTATASYISLFKRLLQRITTLIGLFPAALTGSGNFKVAIQETGVTQPVSHAAASQADGHSATIGATTDTDSANTVIGRLKKIVALLAGGLPAALTGSGNLKTALLEPIPAGSNSIGTVVDGGAGKTLKRAVVSLTASGDIVPATAGKVIKVYAFSVQSVNDGMTLQVKDGASGSALDQVWTLNAREGAMLSAVNPPAFLFKTGVNTALYATITGTGTLRIACSYWDDDAS